MASTLATSSFVSRVFQQRIKANRVLSTQRVSTSLTARRAITRVKLGLCAMSSSATDLDKSTPEDKWREVLGTEEVHAVDYVLGLLAVRSLLEITVDLSAALRMKLKSRALTD